MEINFSKTGLKGARGDQNATGDIVVSGNTLAAAGLFSREEIQKAKYSKFYRFGSVNDPYSRMTETVEYLFFVKPDLHIMNGSSGQLNEELSDQPYFIDLWDRYPDVVHQLQSSSTTDGNPFAPLLSFAVNSSLDLPDKSLGTMDTAATIYGTSYPYLQDGESSDENIDFSLDFRDTKSIEVYQFFKAYSEYQELKKYGKVTPPDIKKYIFGKRLHNTMGIYRFLVSMDDFETIVHYSYLWGVIPLSVPRSAFSNSTFSDGLLYGVNFQAAFIEDMQPMILTDFNNLIDPYLRSFSTDVPIYDFENDRINGQFVSCPYITVDRTVTPEFNGKKKYKLKWR